MSSFKDFKKAGHWPTLLGAFLYFDFSFMVWVMLGALGVVISQDLALNPAQKGFMVALPLLSGAFFRLLLGSLVDHWGPRKSAMLGLTLTALPLALACWGPKSYALTLMVGAGLGMAGASFAAALPLAGRWYPPQWQGLALGIAGAGNSGTVLAAFFAPRLAQLWGWQTAFGFLLLPWSVVFLSFLVLAKEPPAPAAAKQNEGWGALLKLADTWTFGLRYAVTFGGFVGLASFLPLLLRDQYGLSPVMAGNLTALCVMAGSFVRPVGGALADRFGGAKILQAVFGLAALLSLGAASLPALPLAVALLFLLLATLGMGNGAVFQLVPMRFGPQRLGRITGWMGALGGVGGFLLPSLLGSLKQSTGSFAWGFGVWAALALLGWALPRLGASLPQPAAAGGLVLED
jgi:NNP family nitrate/nitrite transporter-like MFS transporter